MKSPNLIFNFFMWSILILILIFLSLFINLELVKYVKLFIASIGIMIIMSSAIESLYKYISNFKVKNINTINLIRLEFGYNIILGLEFMVASDIIESIIKPTYYDVGILSVLVVIRTLLSYFLNKELQNVSLKEIK